jgi:kynurenine formamidase
VYVASLDNGASTSFATHRILLGAGVYGIENLGPAINALPSTGARLMVMPMKIEGGSGAPARVVAAVPTIPEP